MTKSTLFLVGVCVGAAAALVTKAMRPAWAYALAGGMIAYETACDAAESSMDKLSDSAEKLLRNPRKTRKS